MEIAENITWTEELERLDVLLSQGQFELLLPGERYGGGEKEIWLVYLMNDAVESFLVFHNARMTGEYRADYKGKISASMSFEDSEYILVVRQGESVVTIFFEDLLTDVHLYDYGEIGHFWVKEYEYLRQLEYRLAIMRDKYDYLGILHIRRTEACDAGRFSTIKLLLLSGCSGAIYCSENRTVGTDRRGNCSDGRAGSRGR